MRMFSTEAKVGAVVLAAVGALAWLTFQIGEFRFRDKGYVIEAVFRTVSGLERESKIRMAGVLVGSVDRIYLRDGLAHAVLRLDDGVEVREDSVVSVASIGILAERYVEITAGSREARILPPGAVVEGRELQDLDQLIARLGDASETISALAASIEGTFGGEDSVVARMLENSNGLVDRVNALIDDNRRHIAALLEASAGLARESQALLVDNREELRGTIANLREFSATLNRHVEDLSGEVSATGEQLRDVLRQGGDDLSRLVASLEGVSAKAETAADELTSILRKIDRGGGTLGELVNDDASLRKVDRAFDSVGDIAAKINAGEGSIGRLVTDDALIGKVENAVDSATELLGGSNRLQMFLGYRGEYLGREGDVKNYVTVKFQFREGKHYLLELVDDPAGKRTTTTTASRIDRPEGGYELTERTVVNDQDQLKFSVQFAKDFGPLTLRGGLIESQGGAALDWRLFEDRLRLSLAGWDFGREEGPHLKLAGTLRLYRDLFVTGGVDDLAEEQWRSAYLGAGILFNDQDLKYLLSLTSLSQ